MKRTILYTILVLLVLAWSGCKSEPLFPENSSGKSISLLLTTEHQTTVNTRAVDENAVNNVHVLICKNGNLYSIRFYNRVLTLAEIQTNYSADNLRFGLSN